MYDSDDYFDSEEKAAWSVRNVLLSIVALTALVLVPKVYATCSVDIISQLTSGHLCAKQSEGAMRLWSGNVSKEYHTSYSSGGWETHEIWARKGQTLEIRYQVVVERGEIRAWLWDTRLYKGLTREYLWRESFEPGSYGETVQVTAPYTGHHELIVDAGLNTDAAVDLAWRLR